MSTTAKSLAIVALWLAPAVIPHHAGGEWLFESYSVFGNIEDPNFIKIADFNGDGIPDAAVAGSPGIHGGEVQVFLADGDGTFTPAGGCGAGSVISSVDVGDFDGDKNLDLAVAYWGSDIPGESFLGIYLGNGAGSFSLSDTHKTADTIEWAAVGDFDGDDNPDIALLVGGYWGSWNGILIYRGQGDGTFKEFVSYEGVAGGRIRVGDLDEDDALDLVVLGSGMAGVRLGNGDGTFGPPTDYPTMGSRGMPLADLNGDSHLDLALTQYPGSVSVLLGAGDGSFGPPATYGAGLEPGWVSCGDMDGDGDVDLVVANDYLYPGCVSILPGKGDGTFLEPTLHTVGAYIGAAEVADFNQDGDKDVMVVNYSSRTVAVALGDGEGGLRLAPAYGAGGEPVAITMGMFDADAHLDLVVANTGSDDVSILLGNGDGSFCEALSFAAGDNPTGVVVGYLDGDLIQDLAVSNSQTDNVSVLLGIGDGTFAAPMNFPAGDSPRDIAVGEFNGDVAIDLAVVNELGDDVSILLGNGDGTFSGAASYSTGDSPVAIAVGRLDGDATLDLAVANWTSNNISILLGQGDGSFGPATSQAVGSRPAGVAVGDFDDDGVLDLAVSNCYEYDVSVFRGNGDGTFRDRRDYPAAPSPRKIVISDLDGDDVSDLVVSKDYGHAVTVYLGNGNGTFQAHGGYGTETHPWSVVAGDFDDDGDVDLATANRESGNVSILLGLSVLTRVAEGFPEGVTWPEGRITSWPNPFRQTTRISFDVPEGARRAEVSFYSVLGRCVGRLVWDPPTSGLQQITWDGRDATGAMVAPGVYLCRVSVDGKTSTAKLVLMR